MPINVKDSGVYKEAQNVYVKDNGVWKEATRVWVYNGGSWKLVHTPGFTVDADSRYSDITGITYDVAFTNTTSGDHVEYYAPIPFGTNYIDYLMIGGGGSGGRVPSSNNGNWVGSGGGASPIMYGRVKVNIYDPNRYIKVEVAGARFTSSSSVSGRGRQGQYSAFKYSQDLEDSGFSYRPRMLVPGGMAGEPGDGTHRRPLYLGHGQLVTDLNPLNGHLANITGFANLASAGVGGTYVTSERRMYYMPHYFLYENVEGTLYSYITGSSEEVQDESELDTQPRATIWKEDSSWALRYYTSSTNSYSVVPPIFPLHPDNVWSDVTYENNYSVSCGMILPEPPKRATGYAGTFRGETDSNGLPQQQQFAKTEGANVSGPFLTSWDGGVPPIRSGASNGTEYGRGGDAYNDAGEPFSTQATKGIVMLKFVS